MSPLGAPLDRLLRERGDLGAALVDLRAAVTVAIVHPSREDGLVDFELEEPPTSAENPSELQLPKGISDAGVGVNNRNSHETISFIDIDIMSERRTARV